MPTTVHAEKRIFMRGRRDFGALYTATTLLSLHWAVVIYINSSFIGQFVSATGLGLLYTSSSALTILIFLFISRVLRRIGNFRLTLLFALLETAALVGMAFADTLRTAVPLFMLHQAIVPLLFFNVDVYMEGLIGGEEGWTGGRRGLLLGLESFAGAVAPLAAGYLISTSGSSFAPAYAAAALLLVPFYYLIIRHFRAFSDPAYHEIRVLSTFRSFWIRRDVRNVFCAHFFLQLLFAWMVIYTPLYLANEAGFDWDAIGLILFVGLMAYVFLEYPVGIIADRYLGEKEMMLGGFLLMAVSTASFTFLAGAPVLLWMLAMFLTRAGASLVEATTESYFFKHTDGTDANIIGFFRITRPLSYVFGALLGSFALLYFPLGALFLVLGLLMIVGFSFAFLLKDTR